MKLYLLLTLLIASVSGNIYLATNYNSENHSDDFDTLIVGGSDRDLMDYKGQKVTTKLEVELINKIEGLENELEEYYSGLAEDKIDEVFGLGDYIHEQALEELTVQQKDRIVENSIRQEAALDKLEIERIDINNRAKLSNLRTQGEIYYLKGGTYVGMCSDNKIIETGPENFFCKALKDDYVIYKETVSKEKGNYICVDALGFSGYLEIEPLGYQCK